MERITNKMRALYTTLGPAERRIADCIFENAHEIVGISITDLAARCACGYATVVRFSRKLGLEGYQELKLRVAAELGASSDISKAIDKGDSCYEIFQKRIADISASLHGTEAVLDPEQLEKCAKMILDAERIVIFGLGNSAAIAQDAAHKLLRLGLCAQACCDNHLQAIIASHLSRGSVAIGISHSGASRDIVEAMRLCKIGGASTIAITNYGTSPLSEESDITLFTRSEETKHSILAMSSRIAQLAIFDTIYTYIVLNADKASRQAIYNTEAALQNKKF
jgi:DNA-binding MurR/RpiR family transcriptional regulator